MKRKAAADLTVGQVSARSGLSVATIHFYEKAGLVRSHRDDSNYRRFNRVVLRRLAVIRLAQRVGLTLSEIRSALDLLPPDGAIDMAFWRELSSNWADLLNQRIRDLESLRDGLQDCIGCGCLSLDRCQLCNPDDALSAEGPGARLWQNEDAEAG